MARVSIDTRLEEEQLEKIKNMYEVANQIAQNISLVPENVVFFMEENGEHNFSREYVDEDIYYCAFTNITSNDDDPWYRLFVYKEGEEYKGMVIRITDKVEIANKDTGEWVNDPSIARIYHHERKNDTEWNILEQMAEQIETCPYILSYPYLIELECDNEEILALYERTKDCTRLYVEMERTDSGREYTFEVHQCSMVGTTVKYVDGKYVFYREYPGGKQEVAWKTTKIDAAEETIRWMLDHNATGARFMVSKNIYVAYNRGDPKVYLRNKELTKTEKAKAQTTIRKLGFCDDILEQCELTQV